MIKKIKNKIYNWLMDNLPTKVMYNYIWIDSQHQMWIPRWGWSEKQVELSTNDAEKLNDNINWD